MSSKDPPNSGDRTKPKSEATVGGADRIGLASEATLHGSDRSAVTREARSRLGQRSLIRELIGRLEIRMLGLALLLGILLTLLSPHFLTSNNLLNVLDQSVVVGIVAIGM